MENMKKRQIDSGLVVALVCIPLVACGGSASNPADADTSTEPDATADSAGPTDAAHLDAGPGDADGSGSPDGSETDGGPVTPPPGGVDPDFHLSFTSARPSFIATGSQGIYLADDGGLSLARYGYDGTLDESFSRPGTHPADLAVDAEERLLVLGSHGLARALEDGSDDVDFADGGWLGWETLASGRVGPEDEFSSVDLAVSGGVWALGVVREPMTADDGDVWIAKVTASGDLDASFASGGVRLIGMPEGLPAGSVTPVHVAAAGDGSTLVSATVFETDVESVFIALDPSGSLASTFGTGGILRDPVGRDEVEPILDSAGRILVPHANEGRATVRRLAADGTPDLGFGSDSFVDVYETGLTEHVFGRGGGLIAVGRSQKGVDLPDLFVTALHEDGTKDMEFGEDGTMTLPSFDPTAAAMGADGHLFVVGCTLENSFGVCTRTGVRRIFL